MLFQTPNTFAGLGAITKLQIEREFAMRGVFVEDAAYTEPYSEPYSEAYTEPVTTWQPEPEIPAYTQPYTEPQYEPEPIVDIDWNRLWDILPSPDQPVVIVPGGEIATDPWVPNYPYIPGPELREEFTAPFTEELTLPLTDIGTPEAEKAQSKLPLIVGAALVVWAAATRKKKPKARKGTTWRTAKTNRKAAA